MLKHRIDDANSCSMIVYDHDEIIDIKEIVLRNTQLFEKQLIDNNLSALVNILINHKLERN